ERNGGGMEKGRKGKEWNVAGLENKDREFWDRLKSWDAMVLMETWVEEKRGKFLKERLPEGYIRVWRVQDAKRKNKKGRAIRGMLMGIKKELYEREEGKKEVEGFLTRMMKIGGKRVMMIGVYVNMDLERKLERMAE
ncbi:hypothetical protein ALC57_01521, partial [Trachymyrmex cornetzi]